MDNQNGYEWDGYIRLAETDPNLDNVPGHIVEAEAAMFYRPMDLVHSTVGHEESQALGRAANRLWVVKRERLKWPEPSFEAERKTS